MVAGPDAPLFDESPAPPAAAERAVITLSAMYEGYPITIAFAGAADLLPAAVARLRAIGATPPSQKQEWSYTPEGLPICPKHGAPMKKREKQGDVWYSHVVTDPRGEECYCRGYHGKDSPGYEH